MPRKSVSRKRNPGQSRGWAVPWIAALISLLALATGARSLAGQSSSAESSPSVPAQDSSWPDVHLNVIVTDKHGAPQKVDGRSFQLFEDGKERPLLLPDSLPDSADSPVSVALLVDSSGSIFKRRAEIVSAVTAIIRALPADSEVMAVLFNGSAYIDLPLTPASKVDFSFLDRLQASGPTALYDALYAVESHLMQHAKNARRSLVILSDGEDTASHVSIRNAFWSMEQPGAPMVYACIPSKAEFMQSDLIAGHMNMRFLAKRGGGLDFNLDPDPASTAAHIAAAIGSQFVLEFTAADSERNGKAHKIEVRLPDKDLQVHAIPSYHAPKK